VSDGFNRNFGRRQEDAEQQQIEALRRELTVTRALLQLTELRLNAALGMPAQELARCVEALNGASTSTREAGIA
jgi:hypothetical protein